MVGRIVGLRSPSGRPAQIRTAAPANVKPAFKSNRVSTFAINGTNTITLTFGILLSKLATRRFLLHAISPPIKYYFLQLSTIIIYRVVVFKFIRMDGNLFVDECCVV